VSAARGPLTRVHLMRHGEVHNPTKVLYGRLPGFRLSDLGHEMARTGATWLTGRPDADITHLFVSPLERARQTIAPLEAATGLTATIDDRLLESTNVFEGGVVEFGPGAIKHPAMWWHIRNPFRPSWGEAYTEVVARMMALVAEARAAAEGHEAVCVSHQLPVYVTRRGAEGRHLWHLPNRRQCALGSVTTLVYRGAALERVEYAEPSGPGPSKQGNVGA
jgi:broad specificity phosphatase PhoE